jgi:hypothetical protein
MKNFHGHEKSTRLPAWRIGFYTYACAGISHAALRQSPQTKILVAELPASELRSDPSTSYVGLKDETPRHCNISLSTHPRALQ